MARRTLAVAVLVLAGLLAAACSGAGALEDAADNLQVDPRLGDGEVETLKGFGTTGRQYRFQPEGSQNQACELGRQALEEWAGRDVSEETTTPYLVCNFELRTPTAHGGVVDFAGVRVGRAEVDGEFVADADAPGGVDEVVIFFQVND